MSKSDNSNLLIIGIEKVEVAILNYKKLIKGFYFEVLLSRYLCPRCKSIFKLIKPSEALCDCGYSFDPTVWFQQCPDCNGKLERKTFHYACTSCKKVVPSKFLFDERVFDNDYFQEKMRICRDRRRREKAELGNFLRASRSGTLILNDNINFDDMSDFEDDLNQFIGVNQDIDEHKYERPEFVFGDYRSHLLNLVNDEILFSSIEPLDSDKKKDKIFRFMTLIFMEQDRDIWLTQHGDDILVEKNEAV